MASIVHRAVWGAVVLLLAAILVQAGFGFLVLALYLTLAGMVEPPLAALLAGLSALASAALLAVVIVLIARRRRPAPRREAPATAGLDRVALELGETVGRELRVLSRTHAKEMAGAALVAGFAIGISPRLRRNLMALLK